MSRTQAARADSPPTLAALTGLRGVLLFPVLAAHTREYMQAVLPTTEVVDNGLRSAFLAVDVFFILSGFVLSYNYAERFSSSGHRDFRGYFVSRFARIYPVYLLTLVLTGVTIVWVGAADRGLSPLGFVSNIFMAQMMPGAENWNMPSWSVACEVGAYLAFPFVAPVLVRCGWRAALVLGVGLTVGLAAAVDVMSAMNVPALINLYYWARLVAGFALGCLAWVVWQRCVRVHRRWDLVVITALLAVAAIVHIWEQTPLSYVVVGALALVVLGLAASTGPTAAFLGRRRSMTLGEWSYSVYLVHYPVFLVLFALIPADRVRDEAVIVRVAALAAFFVLPLVAGALLFRYVEEPARHWIRRRAARGSTAPRAAAGAGAGAGATSVTALSAPGER